MGIGVESSASHETREDVEQPFKYLINFKIHHNAERKDVERVRGYLRALGLNTRSTVGDVRQVAETVRNKFRRKKGGINCETFCALEWALRETHDVIRREAFVYFLTQETETLEEIAVAKRYR